MDVLSLFQGGQGSVFEGFPNILAVFTKVFYAFRLAFRHSAVDPSDRVGLRFGDVGVLVHAVVRLDRGGDRNFEVGILAAPRFGYVGHLVAVDGRVTTDHDF